MFMEEHRHCRALASSHQAPPHLPATRPSPVVRTERNAGRMSPTFQGKEEQYAESGISKRNGKEVCVMQAQKLPLKLQQCSKPASYKYNDDSNLQNGSEIDGFEFLPDNSVTSLCSLEKSSAYHEQRRTVGEKVQGTYQQKQIMSTTPAATTPSTPSGAPVLYSAIGSLENASANSFGKVRSQYQAFSERDFQYRRTEIKLICPDSNTAKELFANANPISEENKSETLVMNKSIDEPTVVQEISSKQVDNNKNAAKEPCVKLVKSNLLKLGESSHLSPSKQEEEGKKRKDDKGKIQRRRRRAKPIELFRPSCDAYTPRIGVGYPRSAKEIKYKPAESRTSHDIGSSMGTLSRPNFKDALRRVAMIMRQHILKIERRFETNFAKNSGLFKASMMETFSQYRFCNPTHKCTMVRLPMARPGVIYGMRQVQSNFDSIPTEQEIYEFGHRLFQAVQLSSECSIVCLIYVERLMEVAKVPLVARTWRPIFMCGLLLASKVWQDLSSWNIEFASVYPQFSLDQINQLELLFLKNIQWDLYISSSLYAKYYFALRSLLEKRDFRNRYNHMVLGNASAENDQALKVQQRSEQVRDEALLQLSRSM